MRQILLAASALLLSCLAAHATVIDFNGVQDYKPLTTYTQNGFSVTADQGPWMYGGYFGGGNIYAFAAGANAYLESSVIVSYGGSAFTLSSLDLANDVGIANYAIEGFDGSQLAYAISGTLPTDPIGYAVLRTYGTGYSDTPITSLLIGENLVGGAPSWGAYDDVTIDNIMVNAPITAPVAATPEPSSFALLGTGMLGLAGIVKRRFA